MNLVIDTNIIFSSIINPNSNITKIIFHKDSLFNFIAPDYLKEELHNLHKKLLKYSKLNEMDLVFSENKVYEKIQFIDLEIIDFEIWEKLKNLKFQVDYYDFAFIALSLKTNCKLWTSDKKLIKSLSQNGIFICVQTNELLDFIK